MITFFSRLLILSGILFLLFGFTLLYQRYSPNRLAFAADVSTISSTSSDIQIIDMPSKLVISSRGITQDIYPAEVLAKKWEVNDKGVSFLRSSTLPGEVGNSIMYGHNWTSILGNLKDVKPNDLITISFESGKEKQFIVEYVYEVKPSQIDILAQTDYPRLTIYTCSGFLDSKRLVVTARLI